MRLLLLVFTLLDQWISASGGKDVWDRVHSVEYTITTVWYDTAGVEVRRRPRHVWVRKDPGAYKVRVERKEAAGHYVQVWNGGSGWATLNGTVLHDSTQVVREIAYVAADLSYWIGLPWKLNDPGVRLSWPRRNVLHVTFADGVGQHDGDRFWYHWENSASPFPTRVEYIEEGKTENDRERVLFMEWRRIGPVVYSSKRQRVDQRGRVMRAFEITAVKINRKIPDRIFSDRSAAPSPVRR